jgi:hypothetical protein
MLCDFTSYLNMINDLEGSFITLLDNFAMSRYKNKEQIENSCFITWINKAKVCKQSIACFSKVEINITPYYLTNIHYKICIYFNVNDHTFDNFLINNSKLWQGYIISFNVCQAHDNCTLYYSRNIHLRNRSST